MVDLYGEYLPESEYSRSPTRKGALNRQLFYRTSMLTILSSSVFFTTTPEAAAQDNNEIDEIIVTATKRETNLLETPVAVSVVGENEINQRRLVGMEDYLAGIPGVTFSDRGAGSNTNHQHPWHWSG